MGICIFSSFLHHSIVFAHPFISHLTRKQQPHESDIKELHNLHRFDLGFELSLTSIHMPIPIAIAVAVAIAIPHLSVWHMECENTS